LTAFFFVFVVLVGLVDLALDLEALAIPPALPLWENSADRGRVQYSSYRSFADTLNSLNEDGYNDDDIGRASALQLALNLVSFKEVGDNLSTEPYLYPLSFPIIV
jgi:hypothetical protein